MKIDIKDDGSAPKSNQPEKPETNEKKLTQLTGPQ